MMVQSTKIWNQLIDLNPEHLWLEFSPQEKEKLRKKAQNQQSHLLAQNKHFQNQISANKLMEWLETETNHTLACHLSFPEADLPSIWEFVNGTAITFQNHRLIIIPSEGSDLESLEVPQEWVDLPEWQGDYYLAIQLEPEADLLRVWGYVTQQQLKARGRYNAVSKIYEIERQDLIEDINFMVLAHQWEVTDSSSSAEASLPEVSTETVKALLDQHYHQPGYSLRMLMPFPEWASFLRDSSWRKQVYYRRLGVETPTMESVWQNTQHWLQAKFQQGWQSLASFLETKQQLAYQVRNHSSFSEEAGAAKIIDFGVQLHDSSVALLVVRVPAEEDKIWVHVQVHPVGEASYLPPYLQLELLDENGEAVQNPVIARNYDHLIQLKRFKAPVGTPFQIKLSLDQASVTEKFVL